MNKKYIFLPIVAILSMVSMSIGTMGFAQTVSTGSLSCSPATQNVTLGGTIHVTATGGDGSYVWSSPDLTIIDPTGTGFSANYASIGAKTLTVKSAGLTTTCLINVLSSTVVPPVVVPSLPNTGGGFGR